MCELVLSIYRKKDDPNRAQGVSLPSPSLLSSTLSLSNSNAGRQASLPAKRNSCLEGNDAPCTSPWLGSRCLHPFSPLFDATTIAYNARPRGDALEAVISHFTFEEEKKSNLEGGGLQLRRVQYVFTSTPAMIWLHSSGWRTWPMPTAPRRRC